MNDEQNIPPVADAASNADAAKPAPRRKAAPRSRKKTATADDAPATQPNPSDSAEAPPAAPPAGVTPQATEAPSKPTKPRRAPRKKAAAAAEQTPPLAIGDLFATEPTPAAVVEPSSAAVALLPAPVSTGEQPTPADPPALPPAADNPPPSSAVEPADQPVTAALELAPEAPLATAVADEAVAAPTPETTAPPAETPPALVLEANQSEASASEEREDNRNRRKRRRGRTNTRSQQGETAPLELGLDTPIEPVAALLLGEPAPTEEPPAAAPLEEAVAPVAEPQTPPPLSVVSLGLDEPPTLSDAALAALRAAPRVFGSAEALARLTHLHLDAEQIACHHDTLRLMLGRGDVEGCVVAVIGDGAGDGPGLELLSELGPDRVRVLPGVGRVQAACAALGLSAEIVSVVDLRRAPLAALRGRLRAHQLLALPLADGALPAAIARLLVASGFANARLWVCEFTDAGVRAVAWLATELAERAETCAEDAVLIVATGPSAGLFAELPGMSEAALDEQATNGLPLAARLLVLAWLQPAAWESGWAISEGEASLALEWARAVPTARLRAIGVEPGLLGMSLATAGVGDNLAAVASASPQRCSEWPVPNAVFVRGGVGLSDWLAAAWACLAPGGRLVATAEDDTARADLLAFAQQVPASAWQELSLSTGNTVGGRLRFAPSAPVRVALWRKPLAES